MKIAKYIFLLILLTIGTVSVFVATKDGSYTIERKKIIDVPKSIVYKYVTDKQNWDSINPWKDEIWKINKIENPDEETLIHNITINEIVNDLKLTIKDTLNKKTVLSWKTEGSLSFRDKFLSIIGRGVSNDFADKFDEGLNSINHTLTREINTYTIKLDGFIKRDTIFYIQKVMSAKAEEIPQKIKFYLPKLKELIITTNTPTKGAPFIVYHQKDTVNNLYKFSLAIPTAKKVYTSTDSEFYTGQINPSSTVKATLTGNYNHKKEALSKIREFMVKNNLEQSDNFKEIEVISKNITTDKSASKWITEIFVPVRPIKKEAPVEKAKSVNQDSITEAIVKDILNADKNRKNKPQ
ncbi:AraC family transcriptional regulator [Flavobacterium amniphilum]|uniref:AraC family transcriptional regulator n=1 Tax=Flavobacterium amniphilum TaxID=1834035 RepID=UPI00202A40D9|nr:AraC family transcriptional regulator [Flavobacterium amniphilum]MCL9805423.1 AraC family transcriptional regulator [Flavobacterium amniphilum]